MINTENCLLCAQPRCTEACGKMDPAKLLRSLYFDNEYVVRNELPEPLPCADCDGRCETVCPTKVSIRKILSSARKEGTVRKEIDENILRTDFCGIPLENPFLLSSSCVSSTYDMCARAFEAGWAGVAFKTVCLMDIHEASPRYSTIKGGDHRVIGFKNIEQLSDHALVENLEIFRKLKENYPNKFLLVSIMGRDADEWAYLAEKMSDSGADALDLNFSCPNMTVEHTGSDVGQIPELVEEYCRVVREHTKLPFIAKLTPNVAHIEDSAEAAIRGGADGVAAINTIKSLIEVDTNPKDGTFQASIGGYSGKAVKPIALRFIAELAQDPKLQYVHISAMGGIETWRDALEFIVLGADTVQVTTAVMLYGYRIIEDLRSGMAFYLQNHGFTSLREIRGATINDIVPTEKLDRSSIIYPKFLRDKCVGCGRCYLSCRDAGHQAISFEDRKPKMDPRTCVGCHLCVQICPRGAIVSSGVSVSKPE